MTSGEPLLLAIALGVGLLGTLWLGFRRLPELPTGHKALLRERVYASALLSALAFSVAALVFLAFHSPEADPDSGDMTIARLRALNDRFPEWLVDLVDHVPPWWFNLPVAVALWFLAALRMRSSAVSLLHTASWRSRVCGRLKSGTTLLSLIAAMSMVACAVSIFGGAWAAQADKVHQALRAAELRFDNVIAALLEALATEAVAQSIAALHKAEHPNAALSRQADTDLPIVHAALDMFIRYPPRDEQTRHAALLSLESSADFALRAGKSVAGKVVDGFRLAASARVDTRDGQLTEVPFREHVSVGDVFVLYRSDTPIKPRRHGQGLTEKLATEFGDHLAAAVEERPAMTLFAEAALPMLAEALNAYSAPQALGTALNRMWADALEHKSVKQAAQLEAARSIARIGTQAHWSRLQVDSTNSWVVPLHNASKALIALPLRDFVAQSKLRGVRAGTCILARLNKQPCAEAPPPDSTLSATDAQRLIAVARTLEHPIDESLLARDHSTGAPMRNYETAFLAAFDSTAKRLLHSGPMSAQGYQRKAILGDGYCCKTRWSAGYFVSLSKLNAQCYATDLFTLSDAGHSGIWCLAFKDRHRIEWWRR